MKTKSTSAQKNKTVSAPRGAKKEGKATPAKKGKSVSEPRTAGRPAAPILTRHDIIRVAVEIIDRDGLDKVSIRRIGRELGVTGASLYHHFSDKDEILLEVVKHLLRDMAIPDGKHNWQEHVVNSTLAYREALMKHPNAATLLSTRPWRTFGHEVIDGSIQALSEGGLPEHLHLVIMRASEMIAFASAVFNDYSDNDAYGPVAAEHTALKAAIEADHWTSTETLEIIVKALVAGFSASMTLGVLPVAGSKSKGKIPTT